MSGTSTSRRSAAETPQDRQRCRHRGVHVRGQALEVESARHADHCSVEARFPIQVRNLDRPRDRCRIAPVPACHRCVCECGVLHAGTERAESVQGVSQRECAVAADAAESRLQAGDAAKGSRYADRASRVRAQRERAQPGCLGGRRPAASTRPEFVRDSRDCEPGPKCGLSLVMPYAHSCIPVLPTRIAPARRSLWITAASRPGMLPAMILDPTVVGTPRVSSRSFAAYGMPCSGPRASPARISASALAAWRRACSAVTVRYEFSVGSSLSMRCSDLSDDLNEAKGPPSDTGAAGSQCLRAGEAPVRSIPDRVSAKEGRLPVGAVRASRLPVPRRCSVRPFRRSHREGRSRPLYPR